MDRKNIMPILIILAIAIIALIIAIVFLVRQIKYQIFVLRVIKSLNTIEKIQKLNLQNLLKKMYKINLSNEDGFYEKEFWAWRFKFEFYFMLGRTPIFKYMTDVNKIISVASSFKRVKWVHIKDIRKTSIILEDLLNELNGITDDIENIFSQEELLRVILVSLRRVYSFIEEHFKLIKASSSEYVNPNVIIKLENGISGMFSDISKDIESGHYRNAENTISQLQKSLKALLSLVDIEPVARNLFYTKFIADIQTINLQFASSSYEKDIKVKVESISETFMKEIQQAQYKLYDFNYKAICLAIININNKINKFKFYVNKESDYKELIESNESEITKNIIKIHTFAISIKKKFDQLASENAGKSSEFFAFTDTFNFFEEKKAYIQKLIKPVSNLNENNIDYKKKADKIVVVLDEIIELCDRINNSAKFIKNQSFNREDMENKILNIDSLLTQTNIIIKTNPKIKNLGRNVSKIDNKKKELQKYREAIKNIESKPESVTFNIELERLEEESIILNYEIKYYVMLSEVAERLLSYSERDSEILSENKLEYAYELYETDQTYDCVQYLIGEIIRNSKSKLGSYGR